MKFPKPWFRPARGVWYVTLNGRQINLGTDKAVAVETYRQLLGRKMQRPQQPQSNHFETHAYEFILWCQAHRSPATAVWYKERLESFLAHAGEIRVDELKPFHVQRWCDAHAWSDGMKRGAMIAIQRCLNWAVKQGYLERSPIAYLEKPRAGRRERLITEAEYSAIISHVKDEAFRDLLVTSWETGCRPQESLIVEAKHVDLANSRWVLPIEKSKGKRSQRVVYLTAAALAITKRLMLKHPEGPLFRNADGNPFTPFAVNCRFVRLKKKLGVKYCLYLFRHAWMTRMLQSGVDPITVSTLAGHADTSMLARVYAHLAHDPKHLLAKVQKGAG